jgi:hypothetical protein
MESLSYLYTRVADSEYLEHPEYGDHDEAILIPMIFIEQGIHLVPQSRYENQENEYTDRDHFPISLRPFTETTIVDGEVLRLEYREEHDDSDEYE